MQNTKAVIYARVSSREQERDGFSIPAQMKLLKEYALKNGFQIVNEYSDNETAKKQGRTNFNEMLSFFNNNPDVKILLVEKTDRLYRNFKDYITLEDYELEVHLVKEGSIISKNSRSHDKFIHGIKVLMAKNYIDNLSEEISKGLKEAIAEGYWPFMPPYGYKRGKNKALEINNQQALFVHKAFELYETGKYSIRSLAEKLFQEGYYYTEKRPKISHTTLEGMLKNVIYTGRMKCNGEIYNGNQPSIIDNYTFEKVQENFIKDCKSKIRKHFEFYYPGLVKCGVCGYSMCGEVQKKKFVYYRCSHFDRKCSHTMYVSEKELTTSFRWHLKRIALDENTYELVKTALKDSLGEHKNVHKAEIEKIRGKIEKLEDQLRKMYLDKVDGIIDTELWLEFKKKHETELNKLKMDYNRHEQSDIDYMAFGIKILDVCRQANLSREELTPDLISTLLHKSAKSITCKDKHVKLQFVEPFNHIETLKKRLKTASNIGSSCTKWWRIGDSNS